MPSPLQTLVAAASAACVLLAALPGSATAEDLAELKLGSTSKGVFDNLAIFVAEDAGFFKEQGLKVEVSHFRGGGEVVRAVSAGTVDLANAAASSVIIAISRGENLKIVSAFTAPAYALAWIVPPDSPIKTVKDLAGKSVGFSRPGSVTHTGLTAALKANGIEDKVKIVPVGSPGDSLAALKSGRVQATWSAVPEVYGLAKKGEVRILFEIQDYLTDYQTGVFVARTDTIKAKADLIRKFLKAMDKADKLISTDRARAIKVAVARMDVTEEEAKESLDRMPKRFFQVGAPRKSDMDGSIAEAVVVGSLKKAPTYDELVDANFGP